MSRQSVELAIVRSEAQKSLSAPNPVDAALGELEKQISNNRDRPISALLSEVVARVCSLTHADGAAIAMRDEWGIVCRASVGDAPAVGSRLQPDSALTRQCFETGAVVVCNDTETDYRVRAATAKSLRLRSAVVVPIPTRRPVFARLQVLGLIEILSSRPFAFATARVDSLKRGAQLLATASTSARPGQPTLGQRGAPSGAKEAQRGEPDRPLHPEASAPTSPISSPGTSPGTSAKSAAAAPERLPLAQSHVAEDQASSVIRPAVPALVIREVPPGNQILVDDKLASAKPSAQTSISTMTAGLEPLALPTLGEPAKAPILAVTPVVPPPVTPRP